MKKVYIAMIAAMGFIVVACSGDTSSDSDKGDHTEMNDQKEGDGHDHDGENHEGHDH